MNAWFMRFASVYLKVLGTLCLFLTPVRLFLRGTLPGGWMGYLSLLFAALLLSLVLCRPKRSIRVILSSPDVIVEIKVGDLFKETGHLVIGTNDVFDTELGEVIKPTSVQGQFLTKVYEGDQARLDADIESALRSGAVDPREDPDKTRGKRNRYPIGTVAVLGSGSAHWFLLAYTRMGNNLVCTSDAALLWHALERLWCTVRERCQGTRVCLPILGSDLARIALSRAILVKIILISFLAASKQQFITRHLTLVVHPKDLDHLDTNELARFLADMRAS